MTTNVRLVKQGFALALAVVAIVAVIGQLYQLKPSPTATEIDQAAVKQTRSSGVEFDQNGVTADSSAHEAQQAPSTNNTQSQPTQWLANPTQIPEMTDEIYRDVVTLVTWYLAFQKAYSYDKESVQMAYHYHANGALSHIDYDGADPLVIETFRQLYRENPELFLELLDVYHDDTYLRAVFESSLSASNVAFLEKPIREGKTFYASLATEFDLHIQNPNLYLDLYRAAQQQNIPLASGKLMSALVEIDYWQFRDELIDRAVHSPYPSGYFTALESKADVDLNALAQKMWQQHQKNSYAENDSYFIEGKLERVNTALKYGIEPAWDDAYRILQDDNSIAWQFENLGLTEPKTDFPAVRAHVTYDPENRQWTIPEAMRTNLQEIFYTEVSYEHYTEVVIGSD